MYDPYSEFTKHVLPNNLEVHSLFWDRPWIGVEIVVHSGSREDPLVLPGLAHFVEHVISYNIPNREHNQSVDFFEAYGCPAGFGSTNYLSTRFRFCVPADLPTFRKALAIFGSMLLEARIEKSVERERDVIFQEFRERYPFIERLKWDMGMRRALFAGHRLETWNRPLGRPEGFLTATKADLQTFYDKHYVPANISLITIGGLSTKETITELKKSPFGIQKDGLRNPIPEPFNSIPAPTEHAMHARLSDFVSFKIDQTEYKATWAFPADFPGQARRVFNNVLDKILYSEIREKRGFAYSICNTYVCFQDVYEYEISGRIITDATRHIHDLIQKCISMVALRRDLFEKELESCRKMCQMTDLSGLGLARNSASDLVSDHRIIPIQEAWDELHGVTFEHLTSAATFLSAEQQYTFILSP
ncbi:MAG: insulinase family protein [Candidatus Pacebacteria bacterium]|nr:insulinase family protein [Candidatus Paceibacterota bacterium]